MNFESNQTMKPTILTFAALLTAGLLMSATGAHAAPLFEESFDYSDGELNSVSSGDWTQVVQNGGGSNLPEWRAQDDASLSFTKNSNSVVTSGGHARAFTPDAGDDNNYEISLGTTLNSGVVYVGWLQISSPGGNQDTLLQLDNATSTDVIPNAPISMGLRATSSENVFFDTNAAPEGDTGVTAVDGATNDGTDIPSAQANFLVVELDFTGAQNTARFFVDPDPLDLNDNAFASASVDFNGDISLIRIVSSNNHFSGDFNGFVDEIRVGDSFLDVTGIPEPASVALLGLGGLAMLGRHRRGARAA